MPVTTSTGIFPGSGALRSQSQGSLSKLFFASTSETMYAGRQLLQEDQNESLSEVVNIGHRKTRYLPFRYSKAPLPGRGACRYTQDFRIKPVGDHLINHSMAESKKEPPAVPLPSYGSETLHSDSWRVFGPEEMRESKPGLAFYRHSKTNTLKEIGAIMDQKSHAHRRHHGRWEEFCRPESAPPGIDNLYLTGRGGALETSLRAGDCYKTSNQDQFYDYRYMVQRPDTAIG